MILGSTCNTLKSRLILQNSAVRAISGFWRMQLISPACSKFVFLKLDDQYKFEMANFNNTLPRVIISLFVLFTDIHLHYTRSNSNLNYYFPSFKTSRL